VDIATPLRRLSWREAMDRYGSDKPDVRFGLELRDVTAATRGSGFRVFADAPCVKGIVVPPEHAQSLGRNQLDKLTDFVKKREHGGAKGLAWARVQEGGVLEAPYAKNLSAEVQAAIVRDMGAPVGSLLLFVADSWATVHTTLCALRLELRDKLGLLAGDAGKRWEFLWVTEFPLFERTDRGTWVSAHHPFTSPKPEHVELLSTDPGQVLAQAYDLVLNGNEIGGGSIRIHRSDVQAKIFEVLGLSREDAERKFGFLLEAFRYGPPPHGGIALGLDRMAMLVTEADSLRDVIAFPKTQKGQDLMTSCPTPVEDAQLAELFIRHRPLPTDTPT
jgi:aspartyl-tRNA synthetase